MYPQVSVIIPVYNGERFVAEAVNSALAQDYPSKEVLVIDDGSRDRTTNILASYGSTIRVISVPNGGPARARNLGMREAQGEFIAFLDADDVWAHGKLSAQVAHLQAHPETGVCYTGWHVWHSTAGSWHRPEGWPEVFEGVAAVPARSGRIFGDLLLDCRLLTTTVMLRSSIARAEGEFDINLPVGEDYDYWLRLALRTNIDRLNFDGALYRVVPGSASRRPHGVNHELLVLQRALERFRIQQSDHPPLPLEDLQRRLYSLHFQHGWAHLQGGDPAIARQAFAACLRQRPFRLPLWLHWGRAWLRSLSQGAAR
ncbi:glycosyltransferase family 2 protein [Rubrivivax rivuli]|uniref:Glycosyltransferase n=1 Tax=Rubrivivax rivuli TaxID=1862385 RepID=A0A437RSU0_9BURK|nr:glycosyltransferase family 2 protein [Rubrivivax rivuli]RVU49828.1 glycosyltransferase [Rubrivivax rivuli]